MLKRPSPILSSVALKMASEIPNGGKSKTKFLISGWAFNTLSLWENLTFQKKKKIFTSSSHETGKISTPQSYSLNKSIFSS